MKRIFSLFPLRRRLAADEGFTLIELVIAMGVILTALLAMAYTATIGFSDIALARQRQGANGLADQAMEQIRGLPFDTIKKGLATWDVGTDANIVACGTLKCYNFKGVIPNENIPTSGYPAPPSNPKITPLVPHVQTLKVGATSYTVSAYVTYYKNDTTQSSTYRAIVTVTWTNTARHGVSSRVENQSILYSGNGCLSTATHPFAAPCQPFFYGTAASATGHVDVTGNLPGADFSRGSLWLADFNSTMQIEQVSAVQGNTQTSGVSILPKTQPENYQNRVQVSSAADNDPSQSDPAFDSHSLPSTSAQTVKEDGSTGSLWVASTAGDTGSTTSTTSASATNPCLSQLDDPPQPCGSATSWQGQNGSGSQKTMSTNLDLKAGSTDLGAAALVALDSPSAQSLMYTDRAVSPELSNCLGTSGDGCVHAEGSRYLGQFTVGALPPQLPPGSAPPGWLGYLVRVSDFHDSAMVEVGKGTRAPTVLATGTISYWNGLGYSTVVIAPGAPATIPVGPVSIVLPLFPGGPLTVTMQVVQGFGTGGTSLSDPAACGANCDRASAKSVSNSPLTGDVLYKVTFNTVTLADLDIHIDLGTLTVSGEYKVSPSG